MGFTGNFEDKESGETFFGQSLQSRLCLVELSLTSHHEHWGGGVWKVDNDVRICIFVLINCSRVNLCLGLPVLLSPCIYLASTEFEPVYLYVALHQKEESALRGMNVLNTR